jgi:hypothetical protein
MKLHEIIELNGKEYTVELNRESVTRIEQYTNIEEADKTIKATPITDKTNSEITDGENPFEEVIDYDEIDKMVEEKEKTIRNVISRAFWIWLYPVEKLDYSKVKEILEPYFVEEDKANYISEKYTYLAQKSVEVRNNYIEERKNLKALTK